MSERGSEIVLSETVPEAEGKIFLGWSLDKDATKAELIGGESFKVEKDTTFYAIWK